MTFIQRILTVTLFFGFSALILLLLWIAPNGGSNIKAYLASAISAAFGLGLAAEPAVTRLDRYINKRPPPPYYTINRKYCPSLELDSDGSYESCLEFLSELQKIFAAEYTEHLESGPELKFDKNKGYWNVRMFDQDFLVMRIHGAGMCIYGPKPPHDISGFLQVAQHFGAEEFLTWQQKVKRLLLGE